MKIITTQWISQCCNAYPVLKNDNWSCKTCSQKSRFATPKTETVKLYHASKSPDLCSQGIQTNQLTTCSIYKRSKHIYIGTKKYIYEQYLKYCPRGTYYVYEVEVDKDLLEELPAKGQWRTPHKLLPKRIVANETV